MAVMKVVSEDPRYLEKRARPLHEDYPENSPVIFLGEHAYGVAAKVTGTTEQTLSVTLAVSGHALILSMNLIEISSSSSPLNERTSRLWPL